MCINTLHLVNEQKDRHMSIDDILLKDVDGLTDAEKGFLREHASELENTEKESYKDILENITSKICFEIRASRSPYRHKYIASS